MSKLKWPPKICLYQNKKLMIPKSKVFYFKIKVVISFKLNDNLVKRTVKNQ